MIVAAMTGPPARERAEAPEELFFDARLSPHRSLSPRGFLVLMCAFAAAGLLIALGFMSIGAWPVSGFLGLDVALVYLGFRLSYRHGRMYETLRLSRAHLLVERVEHWGERRSWRFQPAWLQVLIDAPARREGALTLRSHGRSLAVGRFLSAAERADLARALRAALERARSADQSA
jgi:uncharacterized membrane protein